MLPDQTHGAPADGTQGPGSGLLSPQEFRLPDGSAKLRFRAGCRAGESVLIGRDKDILCFVEVNMRSTRDRKPEEAAVDGHKRREVAAVVRECLRRLPPSC